MKYYDKTGNEITRDELMELFSDFEYRKVAQEKIGNWFISTVWLGLDAWDSPDDPLLFETMVFPSDKDFTEDWVERTRSLADATAAHQRAVEYVERKIAGTQ